MTKTFEPNFSASGATVSSVGFTPQGSVGTAQHIDFGHLVLDLAGNIPEYGDNTKVYRAIPHANAELRTRIKLASTGEPYPSVWLRATTPEHPSWSPGNGYLVDFGPWQTNTLLKRKRNGVESTIDNTGGFFTFGETVNLLFRVKDETINGVLGTNVQCKVWTGAADAPEPPGWTLEAFDTSPDRITAAGNLHYQLIGGWVAFQDEIRIHSVSVDDTVTGTVSDPVVPGAGTFITELYVVSSGGTLIGPCQYYVVLGDAPAPAPTTSRNPLLHPFDSTSIWNMPLGVNAHLANDYIAQALQWYTAHVNANEGYSHPVITASASDPEVKWYEAHHRHSSADLRVESYIASEHDTNEVRQKTPTWATPEAGTDGHLHVQAPGPIAGGFSVVETWLAKREWDGIAAGRVCRTDLKGMGMGIGNEAGTRAHGMSAIGGLVRKNEIEIANPFIPHALSLGLGDDQLSVGFVWPARADDYWYAVPGPVKMGMLFTIDPGLDINAQGWSIYVKAFAWALRNYGAYVSDYAIHNTFYVEPGISQSLYDHLREGLTPIMPYIRRVTNVSESGWNTWRGASPRAGMGGGAPRVPYASAL